MPSHIHQDVFIKASPSDIYSAFMDEKQHSAVGSTDRRNTLGKLLSWRLILQGLPWSFV